MTTKKDNIIVTLIVSVVVFGAVFAFWGFKQFMTAKYLSHYAPPPVTISTSHATQQTWHPTLFGVGTIVAIHGVAISPQVSGVVSKILFKSGEEVKANQLLLEQNTSVEEASLKNFKAGLALAQINYDREKSLYSKRSVAKSTLDSSYAALEKAQADVAKTKAQIQYKNIRAPFSGKLGIRQVNLGEFLQPGTQIVTLQSLEKLYVDFPLPEQDFNHLYVGQAVHLTSDGAPKYVYHGKITAINSIVSNDTRTLMVRAIFANKNKSLLPGMFAKVEVVLPTEEHVITVPRTAIAYTLYGDSVYVVKKDTHNKGKPSYSVTKHFVRVGDTRGNQVQILNGLKVGEQVVTSGQLKLNNHARVKINNPKPRS